MIIGLVGQNLNELGTPALLVDRDIMNTNIRPLPGAPCGDRSTRMIFTGVYDEYVGLYRLLLSWP